MRLIRMTLAVAALAGATAVLAQEAMDPMEAHELREEHMKAMGGALGTLGKMAQGETPYDMAAAQAAADALLEHATSEDWATMWPEGSSSEDLEESRALPAIWTDMEDFMAKHDALVEGATAMQAAAGTDLAAVQAAMAGVGGACGGCHETYRAPEE